MSGVNCRRRNSRPSARATAEASSVFANIVLADEINRAPPKTQAALLEAMQEYQVTVDGQTLPLALPFLVLATQNPVEQEGVYRLPEAQLDRFLIRIEMGYPGYDHEVHLLKMHGHPIAEPQPMFTPASIDAMPLRTAPCCSAARFRGSSAPRPPYCAPRGSRGT